MSKKRSMWDRRLVHRKALVATAISAALMTGGVIAAGGTPDPVPNTYSDILVPTLSKWNTANTLTVDGVAGATAKTYIYTDVAAAQAAAADDADWDTGNTGQVYWELDDDSGKAPGIQTVTDDPDFPTNNCIMASGGRPSADDPTVMVPKTCSDDDGSSKRYFLEIMHANTPVDMVFDIGTKEIRYKGVKSDSDASTGSGDSDGGPVTVSQFRDEFGFGRIYRVLQKAINNSDERWVAINVELGHGVGDNFTRVNLEEDGVGFEIRNEVPRPFFDGDTGAPPIKVWNPNRFATFSPKAFDDGVRDRFEPGFFSDQQAGLFPPADFEKSYDEKRASFIGSGDELRLDGAYGAITPNYFSLSEVNGIAPGVFGYMMPDSLIPTTISRYDSGVVGSESDAIMAWWDGSNWLYGQKGDENGDNPYGIVPETQLTEWANSLLGVDDESAPRYASELADDLAGQNMDFFIYINDNILQENSAGELEPKFDNITLRVTGISADTVPSALGTGTPAWIDNPAPELSSYRTTPSKPVYRSSGGGGGGCSYNANAPFDPTLPLVLIAALGALVTRKRMSQQQQ